MNQEIDYFDNIFYSQIEEEVAKGLSELVEKNKLDEFSLLKVDDIKIENSNHAMCVYSVKLTSTESIEYEINVERWSTILLFSSCYELFDFGEFILED